MNNESKEFLYKLLTTASPTGFETGIQRVVKRRMQKYADSVETDVHGNLMVGINLKAERKVMLAGHCDQIGLMVTYVTDEGYLSVSALGGIDAGVLPGSLVTVHTEKGDLNGIVGRKPIHLQSPEERGKGVTEVNKAWVDIGAKNKKEAEKLVRIGDPVTFKLGVTELKNDLIVSPGLDDKAGLFVVMEALRLCSRQKLKVALYAVSTVQEEVGLRGARTAAYGISPDVGIGVDVTFADDNPGKGSIKGVPIKLGGGPVITRGPNINPIVEKMLIEAAKRSKMKYQLEPSPAMLGNDTNAMQITRSGVATASVEIPNRYMHSQVEVCSLSDLENAAKLLAAFVQNITPRTDFRPR